MRERTCGMARAALAMREGASSVRVRGKEEQRLSGCADPRDPRQPKETAKDRKRTKRTTVNLRAGDRNGGSNFTRGDLNRDGTGLLV